MLRELSPLTRAASSGAASLVLAALVGCATAGGAGGLQIDLEVDALDDVNPTSATFEQPVHPADYQGMVSAWYFGHAT